MRRAPPGLALLLALVLPAVLVVGCSSSGGAAKPRSAPSASSGGPSGSSSAPEPRLARFYEQQLDWHDCSGGFECARLTVPVDYTEPARATMRVAVNRLPSSGEHRGSLVVNPGGPGVSGLHYARSAKTAVSRAVREHHDVVGFDPRGVGASRPIDCLTDRQLDAFNAQDGTPDSPAEEEGLLEQGRLMGDGCQRDDPALVGHMGTRDVARDLDVLRAVLGDDRLSYLGKSYGTYLGAIYADLFPARVGRLVLDGPLDPSSSDLDNARAQAVGFQRALDAFLDDCLRRSSCPFQGSRASAERRLQAMLDATDAPTAEGHRQPARDPGAGDLRRRGRVVRQGLLAVPARGAEPGAGRRRPVVAAAVRPVQRSRPGRQVHDEHRRGDLCRQLPRPSGARRLRGVPRPGRRGRARSRRSSAGTSSGRTSRAPPGRSRPRASRSRCDAAGAAPILVVGTTRDPATPYESAQALAEQLDSGHLLTYDGDGHTAYRLGSSCVDTAVDAYLLDGDGARRRRPVRLIRAPRACRLPRRAATSSRHSPP